MSLHVSVGKGKRADTKTGSQTQELFFRSISDQIPELQFVNNGKTLFLQSTTLLQLKLCCSNMYITKSQSHVRSPLFRHYEQFDIFHHNQHNARILLLEKVKDVENSKIPYYVNGDKQLNV